MICVKNKARLISLDYKLNRDHEFLKHQLKVPTDGKGFWVGKKSINHWKRLAKIALEDTIVREVQEWNHSKDMPKVEIEIFILQCTGKVYTVHTVFFSFCQLDV